MSGQLFPVTLYEQGYRDLVSVIPIDATLSPGSKIAANQLGKVPGRKLPNGTWAGYGWRTHEPTVDDVRTWALDGASIGLRAKHFPGLDIDSLEPGVADKVEAEALRLLGPAPVRYGRAPKRLLMYRAAHPFTRMRLWIERQPEEGPAETHLIEMLGDGQQYLVHGIHPGTRRPYTWETEVPDADDLTLVTVEMIEELFAHLEQVFGALGYKVSREGSGRKAERSTATNQDSLHAPSIDALREAVAHIPNTGDEFRDRDSYIRFGAAVRAAAGDDVDAGLAIFMEWAGRWKEGVNEPDTVLADWRRLKPPFSLGWSWLAGLARDNGYNDAQLEFEASGEAPPPPPQPGVVKYTERWLAAQVVDRLRDRLRFVPITGRWLVWDSKRWSHDELLRAQAAISEVLHDIAREYQLKSKAKTKALESEVRRIESVRMLFDVMRAVRGDPSIAVSTDAMDHDPWLLNTPSGAVDLRTGKLEAPRPESLITKITATGPDFEGAAPEWKRFLAEATGGDMALEQYLQRFAGYALTGLTREQMFTFVWGPGGCGKGTFVNAIRNVMGDYAKVAAMDTFTASNFDKHSTDLADLMGARLVTASETQSGRRWDEQRVKLLSGGDPIKARFMRQDNFTFQPQFKMLFLGNHRPAVRDIDQAMRRRLHLVPFNVTPAQVDLQLEEKLRDEYPVILAWMIEGCLMWQKDGLKKPAVVEAATEEYLQDEDAVGTWIAECCSVEDPTAVTLTADLYDNWREWANARGEYVGSQKRFSQTLLMKHFARVRGDGNTSAFGGISRVAREVRL